LRVGIGYDVHALVQGRPLVLGGVLIPFDKGLQGHSDGDVLIHAVIDAILGATGLGDIGSHFPSEDPKYFGIRSKFLLQETQKLLFRNGWKVVNMDATIVAEQPVLNHHLGAMRRELSDGLGIAIEYVSIKAKTNDKMGFLGSGDGVACWAIALVDGE